MGTLIAVMHGQSWSAGRRSRLASSPQSAVIRGESLSIATPVEVCLSRDTDGTFSNFSIYTYTHTHTHTLYNKWQACYSLLSSEIPLNREILTCLLFFFETFLGVCFKARSIFFITLRLKCFGRKFTCIPTIFWGGCTSVKKKFSLMFVLVIEYLFFLLLCKSQNTFDICWYWRVISYILVGAIQFRTIKIRFLINEDEDGAAAALTQ